MKLTEFQLILWALSCCAYAAAAVVMVKRASYARWPFLFSLAVLELAFNLVIVCFSGHYAAYFYVYWATQIIRALLGFGVISDIMRAIPGVTLAPKHLAGGFLAAACTMTAGSAWLASTGGSHTVHLTMMALALDRCIAIAWGTFAISLFSALGFCGFGWTVTPLRVAANFLVLSLISAVNAYAMSAWPSHASRFDQAFCICSIGVWITWSGIMHLEKNEAVMHSDRALCSLDVHS